MYVLTGALIAFASSSALVPAAVDIVEPNPKAMSQAEIRAFNAPLAKSHKYYIRCKRGAALGTYIKREFSCRTNAQWATAEANGNQEARDIGEEMQSKSWNTSG